MDVTGAGEPPTGGLPSQELTLAEKIDRLFKTMHPRDRGPYTFKEVSHDLAEKGVKLSPSYLWQLRHGIATNPTIRQVEALAGFFHVPTTYFFGTPEEVEKVDAQMTVVRALQDSGMRDVVLRASDLTPEGLRALASMAAVLTQTQGMSESRDKKRRPREGNSSPGEGGGGQQDAGDQESGDPGEPGAPGGVAPQPPTG